MSRAVSKGQKQNENTSYYESVQADGVASFAHQLDNITLSNIIHDSYPSLLGHCGPLACLSLKQSEWESLHCLGSSTRCFCQQTKKHAATVLLELKKTPPSGGE